MKKVIKVEYSKSYLNGLKELQKDHKTKLIDKLNKIIVELIEYKVTTQYHNHPLSNGNYELHISGDLQLTYIYKDNKLILVLLDLGNHKEQNNPKHQKHLKKALNSDLDESVNYNELLQKGYNALDNANIKFNVDKNEFEFYTEEDALKGAKQLKSVFGKDKVTKVDQFKVVVDLENEDEIAPEAYGDELIKDFETRHPWNEDFDESFDDEKVKYAVVYRNREDGSLIDAKVYDDYSKANSLYQIELAKRDLDPSIEIDIEDVTPESSLWEESLAESKLNESSLVLGDEMVGQFHVEYRWDKEYQGGSYSAGVYERGPNDVYRTVETKKYATKEEAEKAYKRYLNLVKQGKYGEIEEVVEEDLIKDTEETTPFNYRQVFAELKVETNNFKDDNVYCSYSFKSEWENAIKILKKHYKYVDFNINSGNFGDDYIVQARNTIPFDESMTL